MLSLIAIRVTEKNTSGLCKSGEIFEEISFIPIIDNHQAKPDYFKFDNNLFKIRFLSIKFNREKIKDLERFL